MYRWREEEGATIGGGREGTAIRRVRRREGKDNVMTRRQSNGLAATRQSNDEEAGSHLVNNEEAGSHLVNRPEASRQPNAHI